MTWVAMLKRRAILLPVVVQLMWRGIVLSGQPFGAAGTEVPLMLWGSFIVAACVLGGLVVYPFRWSEIQFGVGAVAAGGPYLVYVAWLITAREVSGIILATIGDLLLIVWLVAGTWGRVRDPGMR